MTDQLSQLRTACAQVAARSQHVRLIAEAIPGYAAALPAPRRAEPAPNPVGASPEDQLAYWITLDAINFGSGWFPTLRKRPGQSGYFTVAQGLRDRFDRDGPWTAPELSRMTASIIAGTLGQDPAHELMELFARSLRDLGERLARHCGGSFTRLLDTADGSALQLVDRLSGWACFEDRSIYAGIEVPFLKRAQIAAADIQRGGLADFGDFQRLTMFADNLVPHVLRLDGVLEFRPELVARIDREELIEHGSPEEVEIRACAVRAVELIVAARPGWTAAEIDELLWRRGQGAGYKARPRHRCRCTAY